MNKYPYIVLACLCLVLAQCTKPKTTPQPATDISSATPYINATIDSTSISLAPGNQIQGSVNNTNLNNGSTSDETYNYQISSLLSLNDFAAALYAGDDEFSPAASKPGDSAFYGYFNRGHKKFSFGKLAFNSYHVAFSWYDNNGNEWQSNPPVGTNAGDQTGSSFVVDTFIQTTPKYGGSAAIKLQAHFSCKIYNGANSKKVTNGTCVVYFENK